MALITAAEAREHIPGIEGTSEDTYLDALIAVVGRLFADYCGVPAPSNGLNTLESATRIVYPYVDEDGDLRRLILGWAPSFPVSSITEIVEDDDLDYTDPADVVTSTDYTLLKADRGWEVRLKSTGTKAAWSTVSGSLRVTLVAGWSAVPEDLKMAARVAVRSLYDGRTTQGVTRIGDRSFTEEAMALGPDVRKFLSGYRQAASVMG